MKDWLIQFYSYLALVDPLFPRPFEISLQTKSRTTARALALVFEEIEEIRKRSVSNEELQRAKEYLIGRLSDAFSTPHAIASTILPKTNSPEDSS